MNPAMSPSQPTTVAVLGDGGLARSVAARLAKQAIDVRLSDHLVDPAGEPLAGLGSPIEQVDASDFSAVEAFLERANDAGTLSGVVNCSGSLLLKPAHLTSEEEFAQVLRSNLTTAFSTVRAAARILGKTGGSVVLVSSAAARLGLPNHEAIAAAKAGIEGLVRSAAATYGPRALRFNAIAPGLMASPMTERITGSQKALESSTAMHALRRIGSTEEVSSLVSWLLGPDATWVTGQVWGVDGGLGSVLARR